LAAPAPDSVAAQMGLRDGDRALWLRANDQTESVRSWADLRMAVFSQGFGDASAVLHVRGTDGAERDLKIAHLPNTGGDPDQDPLATLGLFPKGGPVTISELLPDSAAQRAALTQ